MPHLVRRIFSNRKRAQVEPQHNLLEIDYTKDGDYMVEVSGKIFRLSKQDFFALQEAVNKEVIRCKVDDHIAEYLRLRSGD